MNVTIKLCGQSDCALAHSFPHTIKCKRLRNSLLEKNKMDHGILKTNDFITCGDMSPEYIATTMFNRALSLAHMGYALDALTCYSALVTSFSGNDEGVQEIVNGAKHNHKMLENLIVRFS